MSSHSPLLLSVITLMAVLSCGLRQKPKINPCAGFSDSSDSVEYFAVYRDSADVDWMEVIPVFHYWRSDERRPEWEELCENEFRPEPTERHYVQGNFRSINHYVTVYDLVEVLFKMDSLGNKRNVDDEFVLWRLNQYDTLSTAGFTAEERKESLKKTIDSLLVFVPNTQWDVRFQESLEVYFDEFYSRVASEIKSKNK